jgi:hypothetical protein
LDQEDGFCFASVNDFSPGPYPSKYFNLILELKLMKMTNWGIPSVMQTTNGISASIASLMAAAAKGAKMMNYFKLNCAKINKPGT